MKYSFLILAGYWIVAEISEESPGSTRQWCRV